MHPLQDSQKSFWDMPIPIADQTWAGDWDYYASAVLSLQKYWTESGTIPLWNFHFCGGRPELALPHGLAFTWYSPILYVFDATESLIAVWILLLAMGVCSFYFLLRSWKFSRGVALIGSILFCCNGYFAARFNQGQLTFAFFYLIPTIWYTLMRYALTQKLGWGLAYTISVFAFLNGSLPHGLFYPACGVATIAIVIVRTNLSRSDPFFWTKILGLTTWAFALHAYKLVPIIAWQRLFPRQGVMPEVNPLSEVALSWTQFRPAFVNHLQQYFPEQVWFPWEYSTFVGIIPVVALALCPLVYRKLSPIHRQIVVASTLVLLLGINLSLGSQHSLSIAQYFEFAPILNGIRVFFRFQFLCIIGLVMITVVVLEHYASRFGKYFLGVSGLLAGLPLAAQLVVLVTQIQAVPDREIQRLTASSEDVEGNWFHSGFDLNSPFSYQKAQLKQGRWIGNCYEPMNVGKISMDGRLSRPWLVNGRVRDVKLDATSLTFVGESSEPRHGAMEFAVSVYPFTQLNLPYERISKPDAIQLLPLEVSGSSSVRISNQFPYDRYGILASAVSWIAFLILAGFLVWRRWGLA